MGIELGLLPIVIVGGYFLLTWCYRTRYHLLRRTGYHVFFQSSVAGVVLVISANMLLIVLNSLLEIVYGPEKSAISEVLCVFIAKDHCTSGDSIAIMGLLLGLVLPFLINLRLCQEEEAKRAIKKYGSSIEALIVESLEEGIEVEISLKNRKWYIGFPVRNEAIEPGISDIELVPIASGYRDKDTLDLVESDYPLDEFETRVIIPISEIVTARNLIPLDDEQSDGRDQADGPA